MHGYLYTKVAGCKDPGTDLDSWPRVFSAGKVLKDKGVHKLAVEVHGPKGILTGVAFAIPDSNEKVVHRTLEVLSAADCGTPINKVITISAPVHICCVSSRWLHQFL